MIIIKDIGDKLLGVFLLIIVCSLIIYEISISDVGFDLSDEGWHLSKFLFPEEVKATLSRDHLYASYLFKFINYDLSVIRTINIFILLISNGIFCYGILKYFFRDKLENNKKLYLFITLLSTSIISQMPSLWIERVPAYNNLTCCITIATLGIVFISSQSNFILNNIFYIIIGLLVALSFLIRPPSAIALIIAITTINILSKKVIKENLLYASLGIILLLSFHFSFIENPQAYYDSLHLGFVFDSFLSNGHGISTLERNFNELFFTFKFSVTFNKYIYLSFFIFCFLLRQNKNNKILFSLFILHLLFITFNHYRIGDIDGGLSLYWFQWRLYFAQISFTLFYIIIFSILFRKKIKVFFINDFFLIPLFLLVSPAMFSFGTNNIIMFNMNFFTPIFIIASFLIFLITTTISKAKSKHGLSYLIIIVLCIGPTHSFLHGRLVEDFYTISSISKLNIKDEKETTLIDGIPIKVGKSTKEILEGINNKIRLHKTKYRYLLNFSNMPGLNYFCKLPHPIQPWTTMMHDNFTLRNINQAIFNSSIILLLSGDNLTVKHLDNYFPDWKESHPIKDSISLLNNLGTYDLYFPSEH